VRAGIVRAVGIAIGILGTAFAALAQEPPAPPPFQVRPHHDLYVARVDLTPVFTASLREKINSGLTTRLLLRASVIDAEDGTVRTLSVTEYRILYRVWEEDYIVRRWDALGETSYRVRQYPEVLYRVGRQRQLPVAGREDLTPGRRYYATIEVEIDPVSEELLEKVREYLANPGGYRREGGRRGLFGNLARIFFNPRTGANGSVLELRSEVFVAEPRSR
jgi:hypothetical protein